MKFITFFLMLVIWSNIWSQQPETLKTSKETESKKVKHQIKTVYDILGRPINQSQDAKGFHRVNGTCTLVGGIDTVSLNTSITKGKQDISFIGDSTYYGIVWSLISSDTAIYRIRPITGAKFEVSVLKASFYSDTATVKFMIQGE